MKRFNKVLALLLATLMLVTALPLSVFAAEASVSETAMADVGYWYNYSFDEAETGSSSYGILQKLSNENTNPKGFAISTDRIVGEIGGDSDNKYISANLTDGGVTTQWQGIQASLVKGGVDYTLDNAVEISFKFRWHGGEPGQDGKYADQAMTMVQIRRSGSNTLLNASIDTATGDLIIKTHAGTAIHTVEKYSDTNKGFTDIKVVYYDVTNTFNVYVGGNAVAEGVSGSLDLRSATYVDTAWDDDMISTRTSKATDGATSVQLFRVEAPAGTAGAYEWATSAYVYDVDDIVVKENDDEYVDYYSNTFEGTTTGGSVSAPFAVASGSATVAEETNNQYLSLAANTRLNINISNSSFMSNGNWTIDFKLRATAASTNATFFRFNDGAKSHPILNATTNSSGVTRLSFSGKEIRYPTTVPAPTSSDWVKVTVSVLVDDTNYGETDSANLRNYLIAVWLNNEYVGSSISSRTETNINSSQADQIALFNTSGWGGAAIDDLSIYEGIGPKDLYADGANDTEGTISNVLGYSLTVQSASNIFAENVSGKNPGKLFVSGSRICADTNSSTDNGDYAYAAYDNQGSGAKVTKAATVAAESYLDLGAAASGGKSFAAVLNLRVDTSIIETTNDLELFKLVRQAKGDTAPVESAATLYLEADTDANNTHHLYFIKDGTKYYLTDASDNKLAINTGWATVRVIFDETDGQTLVSYQFGTGNNDPAYVYYNDGTNVVPAVALSGIVSSDVYAKKDAVDQRVRIYYSPANESYGMRLHHATVEYAVAPKILDHAKVDFSDFKSIDEFAAVYGVQFQWSDGVTIENGVLNIPANGYFNWIDYKGTFVNFLTENDNNTVALSNVGYNVEMKMQYTGTETAATVLSVGTSTTKDAVFKVKGQSVMINGGTACPGYEVEPLTSDRYSNISATWGQSNTRATIFGNGTLLGRSLNMGNANSLTAADIVIFTVAGNTKLEELYIHADLERELATQSGDIFKLDAAVYDKDAAGNPPLGIWNSNSLTNNFALTTETPEGGETKSFYRADMTSATGAFVDLYFTEYFETGVTVFEFDLRSVVNPSADIRLLGIRRNDGGENASAFESLLYLASDGSIKISDGANEFYLCDSKGNKISIGPKDEETPADWTNLAVIYDANLGSVSFLLNGRYYSYCDADGIKGVAKDIPLAKQDYKLDTIEMRVRTLDITAATTGTFDLASFNIYKINDSANAELVGVQVANGEESIRIIAGVDMLYYGKVGFNLVSYDENGAMKSGDLESNMVFSSVLIDTKDEYTDYPENYGFRHFSLASVTGIPQDEVVRLYITPYTVVGGVKLYSETVAYDIDFTGTTDDWTVTEVTENAEPDGSVALTDGENANFNTTEIVSFTDDGALEFNALDAEFAFAANCSGTVAINLTNAFGETVGASEFEIYVDDVKTATVQLSFGQHTLVLAEDLQGDHTFKIVKKSGGDLVYIDSIYVEGELTTPPVLAEVNAVEVVVKKKQPTFQKTMVLM